MTRRGNTILGLVLMALVVGVIVVTPHIKRWVCTMIPEAGFCPPPPKLFVYGGYRYFEDPQITAILHDQYRLDVEGEFRKGTFAMADDYDPAKQPVDCIFPGSGIGIDYFNQKHPKVIKKTVVAAQDRIVLYSWKQLLPALQNGGLVYSKGNSWYIHMKPLADALMAGQKWSDINVDIPGYVRPEFTDPLQSSSGAQWMALVGTYLVPGNESGGAILTMTDLQANPTILPQLYTYWERQGAQDVTTGNLFPHFVASGASIPMIVAYESSFTDWYHPLPPDQQALAQGIVGMYPEFTINIQHVLASLTPACDPLLTAISDPKIQQLAWKNHGLYPQGYMPPGCAPGSTWCALSVPTVPEPKKDVTDAIQCTLKGLPPDCSKSK